MNDLPRGALLRDTLLAMAARDRDTWLDTLLGLTDLPTDSPDLPNGSVPYLPCGVEELLAIVADVPVTAADTFVDLGSGVGRAAIFVHLLTGAQACGVEIQSALVDAARAKCAELGLCAVSFVHGDATATTPDGSIFFLYSPFNGDMLKRVLWRLEELARRHTFVVCAVGFELRDEAWLVARPSSSAVAVTVYDATSSIRNSIEAGGGGRSLKVTASMIEK